MYLSLLFWLALALPGYAVVRRFSAGDLRSGLLGTLSLSYLASLALLSPVSILCYVLRAPLPVFSIAVVVLIAAAVVDITRQKAWRPLGSLVLAALGVELLIVVLDVALGARVGAFFGGDAKVHIARIRFLIDRGFSNDDPYIAVPYFFPIYHTNLHHSLFAACCQIMRLDVYGVWFVGLAWAKLVVASGAYYLAWTVFDRHGPAWVAALACISHRGPVSFLLYPNQLSPFWLAPLGLAFALQVCRANPARSGAVKLACVSLVLGQFHGLYVIFVVVMTAPLIAGAAAVSLWKRRWGDAVRRGACLAALAVGLPFIFISRQKNIAAESWPPHVAATIKDPEKFFVSTESGTSMRDPASALNLFGGGAWGTLAVATGLLAGLYGRRRWEVLKLLVAPAVVALMLYTPPICTLLLRNAQEAWILQRIEFIFRIIFMVLCAPSLAFLIEDRTRHRIVRSLFALGALFFATLFSDEGPPWTWRRILENAQLSSQDRFAAVRQIRDLSAFLRANLPPGCTVVTALPSSRDVVMLADCFVVSSASANNGVSDALQRRKDLYLMLHQDLPWETRRALFRKYDARYFFPTSASDWARGHIKQYWQHDPYILCEWALDGQTPITPRANESSERRRSDTPGPGPEQ